MKPTVKPSVYRLERVISNFVDSMLDRLETSEVYAYLKDDFGLTDEELVSLGYDWLVPEQEKPEEAPLKEYYFIYTESRSLCVTIKAPTEKEAWDLIEDYAFDDHELTSNDDGQWSLMDVD